MLEKNSIFPNFTYLSYDGKRKDLYEEIGDHSAAILFLRYMGCTKCRLDVHEVLMNQEGIRKKGIKVFIVFQSKISNVQEYLADFPYEIICDPEQELYRRFDILPAQSKEELLDFDGFAKEHSQFKEKKEKLGLVHGEYEGDELQKPAIFLLDAQKRVFFAHYASSLMDMPAVENWLDMF